MRVRSGLGDPDVYVALNRLPTLDTYDYMNNACDNCFTNTGATTTMSSFPSSGSNITLPFTLTRNLAGMMMMLMMMFLHIDNKIYYPVGCVL